MVTLPAGCYIEVAFLLSAIQIHHNFIVLCAIDHNNVVPHQQPIHSPSTHGAVASRTVSTIVEDKKFLMQERI